MKLNKNMSMILKNYSDNVELPDELRDILNQGFQEVENCLVMKGIYNGPDVGIDYSNYYDKTGFECIENHLHIDDYIEDSNAEFACLIGIKFGKELKKNLETYYPDVSINVIVSCDDTGSTVRFHRIRVGESWLQNDIENYEEAICVL